jgi:NTE family protein
LLPQVRYVSSVSGGSVANGSLACAYADLQKEGFTATSVDEVVILPLIRTVSTRSLTSHLLANVWRVLGPGTRTNLLADSFDQWFFHGRLLEDLPTECRFIFNAASVTTGVRFGLERDVVGDYVMGRVSTAGTGLRVADAVAASAAVPGAFPPLVLKGLRFPCAEGRTAALVDGGAYDNMGLEPVDDFYQQPRGPVRQGAEVCLVALNAGGVFHTGAYGGIPVVRDLQRANALLYRQSTALRMRSMVERFQAWEQARAANTPPPRWARFGVLFGLATTMQPTQEWASVRPEHPEWREQLVNVHTSLGKFPVEVCTRLVYRGWWLAGATLSRFHRQLLPEALPAWRELAP